MDFSTYMIDDHGLVTLSDDLQNWIDEGTSWRRHWLYHQICQTRYTETHGARPSPNAAGSDLKARGFHLFPNLLDTSNCVSLSQSITHFLENKYGSVHDLEDREHTTSWSHQRAGVVRQIMPQIFTEEVVAAIENYFDCHFQIFSLSLNRYLPSPESTESFNWHRDHEPPQQLHMMVYLSGASNDGGRTQVLDLETTRRAASLGYSYPPIDRRTNDLGDIFRADADSVEVISPELSPGGAMIFAAPRNLHRGVLPLDAPRDTLLMLLMPCPISHRVRLETNFARILTAGPHTTCCAFSPFGNFSPSTVERHGNVPEWAVMSEMYPPENKIPD